MPRTLLLAVLVLATPALAAPWKQKLSEAADQLDAALTEAKEAGGYCKQALAHGLRKASDRVDDLRSRPSEDGLRAVEGKVANLALSAAPNGCPLTLQQRLEEAQRDLERARHMFARHQGHHGHDDGDDDDDDDDDDDRRPPPGPPPGMPALVELAPLRAEAVDVPGHQNDMMRLVTKVTLRGMSNRPWTLAWRVRAENGPFSPWGRSERVAPAGPMSVVDAAGVFPMDQLRATGALTFVGEVAVLDPNGATLASRQLGFTIPGRDCGTGPDDPGCNRQRDGRLPMERHAFDGLMASMGSNAGELQRRDMAVNVFHREYLTARQLGAVLGRFLSEPVKLEIARAAAPHVVDPENALALSSKFRSTPMQRDFAALFSNVPMQPGPPGPPPPPPGNPGPPPGPSYNPPVRTCGSDDPGCPMMRDGHYSFDRRPFDGFVDSLRVNHSELARRDMAVTWLRTNYLTARQLGQLFDVFSSDLLKMDVARAAAPHVVDPSDAYGLAKSFHSSLLQKDFVELMSSQR